MFSFWKEYHSVQQYKPCKVIGDDTVNRYSTRKTLPKKQSKRRVWKRAQHKTIGRSVRVLFLPNGKSNRIQNYSVKTTSIQTHTDISTSTLCFRRKTTWWVFRICIFFWSREDGQFDEIKIVRTTLKTMEIPIWSCFFPFMKMMASRLASRVYLQTVHEMQLWPCGNEPGYMENKIENHDPVYSDSMSPIHARFRCLYISIQFHQHTRLSNLLI